MLLKEVDILVSGAIGVPNVRDSIVSGKHVVDILETPNNTEIRLINGNTIRVQETPTVIANMLAELTAPGTIKLNKATR